MPSSSPRSSSSRLARAAGAERMALLREREKLVRRRDAAARQLAAVEDQLAEVQERLELIDRLVPEAANVHPLPARGDAADGLRGAAIRRAAIEVLRALPPEPVHYKAWFEATRDAGHRIAGKDPLAVFLTQISRSPLVVRADEPGHYRLDRDAPANLRARLDRLHARLGEQSSDRAERERLVTEIAITERALDEAEAALGTSAGAAADAGDPRRGGSSERAAG